MTRAEERRLDRGDIQGLPTIVTTDPAGFTGHSRYVICVTPEHAAAAQQLQRDMLANGGSAGPYRHGENSCVTHVEQVLGAAGVESNHRVMNSPTTGSFQASIENTDLGYDPDFGG